MAAAQQTGYSGATSDYWQVGLGSTYGAGAEANSTTINLGSGCSPAGWASNSAWWRAQQARCWWFFAVGTPAGQPPFALLDGVSVTVNEPSGAAVLGHGLLALLAVRRYYRGRVSSAQRIAVRRRRGG